MHDMTQNWQAFAFLKVTRNKKLQGQQSSFDPALRRKKLNFSCEYIQVSKQLEANLF